MLRIYLLGSFRLLYQDQALKFSALPKTLPLWTQLLLNRGKAIPRRQLANMLWPDVNEAEARSNLRRHLYELRRVLPADLTDCPWLLADNSAVQWNPQAPYWLDVDAFTQLHTASPIDPACLAEAVHLYSGDLLPDLDEEWIFFAREQLRNRFFDDLTQLIAHHQTNQQGRQAIGYAQQLLQHDPLREDTVRTLMTLRHQLGDRAGALQAYHAFAQRLRAELDAPPMSETSALYNTLLPELALPENRALPYWYDVEAFTQLCQQAETASNTPTATTTATTTDKITLYEQAIALYKGEFMGDGLSGDWCLAWREPLAQQYERALLALGHAYAATGTYQRAVDIYRRAIIHEPYLEAAYRALMHCLAARWANARKPCVSILI